MGLSEALALAWPLQCECAACPGETADLLKEKVGLAMREMIAQHQVKGGGVTRAVVERLKLLF